MTTRHKITALKDVTVSAHIWFQGSIELPRGNQNQRLGRIPQMQNVEKKFKLHKGDSRDDVAFLISVSENGSFLPRSIDHPQSVGACTQDGDLIRIERVE